MPDLDFIRSEIEHMRVQVSPRQSEVRLEDEKKMFAIQGRSIFAIELDAVARHVDNRMPINVWPSWPPGELRAMRPS